MITVLGHTSGQWLRSKIRLNAAPKPLKDPFQDIVSGWIVDSQGQGSAITYARRYALMAIAGVAPADDDGNASSIPPPPKSRPKAPPPPKADVERKVADVVEKKVNGGMLTIEQKGELVTLAADRYTSGDQSSAEKFALWSFWRKFYPTTTERSISWKKISQTQAQEMIETFRGEGFEKVVAAYEARNA